MSAQAIAVLLAMRGRLFGRLEGNVPFVLDPGWSELVPHQVVGELHEAGLIELDEMAPIGDTYAFRISKAGITYLESLPPLARRDKQSNPARLAT